MTPEQAGELVTYLIAAFPRDAIEDGTFQVFLSDFALLAEYDVGYQAVREIARGEERFPTIRTVRGAYQSVLRRRNHAQAEERGLPPVAAGKPGEIPEWVRVWWWIRHGRIPRDTRYVPQMVDAETGLPFGASEYMAQEDYDALVAEWRNAGEPKLGQTDAIDRIVGSVVQD